MDVDSILVWLQGVWEPAKYVLMALGVAVMAGQAYVLATPKKEDDAWLAKLEAKPIIGHLLRALRSFAPWKPKK